MDLTESIAPKSDQINAEDLLTGPRTFTIEKVTAGSLEQPVDVHLVEFPGRPYRPSKSMRRVMVVAWGVESGAYTGHRLTLYRNPATKFGRDVVGGIEISHMSHIEKRLTLALTVTRGRRAPFNVEPLPPRTDDATGPADRGESEASVPRLPVASSPNPNAELLAEIGALADQTPGGRKAVAADWAETHEGESLRDTTDLGGLELLRDDLKLAGPGVAMRTPGPAAAPEPDFEGEP